ncbi:MAG TPA: hypothetical protein PLD88_01290 [Candidatus Berkiella sp.]|nr:hypothetical protein [Candidatus Berkiella sp.]
MLNKEGKLIGYMVNGDNQLIVSVFHIDYFCELQETGDPTSFKVLRHEKKQVIEAKIDDS